MIKKIEYGWAAGQGYIDPTRETICDKINELVDAINKHEDIIRQIGEWGSSKGECLWCENLTEIHLDAESRPVNVRDKFAEQRQWIGKLCWFWNRNDKRCGILTEVFDNNKYGGDDSTEEYPFQRDSIGCWQHCEPVKPDDDIIYKGDNNESK